MNQKHEVERVRLFIKHYADIGFFSTDARVIDFSKDLYNVSGSTDDPKEVHEHVGVTWKQLLIRFADLDDANCYVTNVIPDEGSNHPSFSVGGHMTPDSTGTVPVGDVSYLMPLCKWHNSTGRDGIAFEHTETKMLELTGFMEGDSAVTFALRLPSKKRYSLLYFNRESGSWESRNLSGENELVVARLDAERAIHEYVLFECRGDRLFVVDTNLSLH